MCVAKLTASFHHFSFLAVSGREYLKPWDASILEKVLSGKSCLLITGDVQDPNVCPGPFIFLREAEPQLARDQSLQETFACECSTLVISFQLVQLDLDSSHLLFIYFVLSFSLTWTWRRRGARGPTFGFLW